MYFFRKLYVFIFLIFVLEGCQQSEKASQPSGIAISFDDRFIKEWYELRPLFQKYGAKVTFFVTCGDSLTTTEIKQLKDLQSDGHEIGFHGSIHGKSTELITLGTDKYLETEIIPGMKCLAQAGIKPTSYAHPGGNHNNEVDSVLLSNGFQILRDVAISRRVYRGVPLYILAPRIMDWIFYKFDGNRIIDALLIDQDSGITDEEIKDAIQKAKDTHTALMLFGHKPLYKQAENGEYGFDVSFLETILKESHRQKLKFYTITELVQTQ